MMASDVPVLCPPPELTDASLEGFEEMLKPLVEASGPGFILDLEEVQFINSTGLGCLVKVGMRMDRQKRRFALARPVRKVEKTIRIIGLDSKLPLFRTLEEAAAFIANHVVPKI